MQCFIGISGTNKLITGSYKLGREKFKDFSRPCIRKFKDRRAEKEVLESSGKSRKMENCYLYLPPQ